VGLAMKRDEAIAKAHQISSATQQTAVVYRRRVITPAKPYLPDTDYQPATSDYDYVPASAYTDKPTKPAGLRLWMWISVTGLERLAGRDEWL
jgi:hypothetical protein